VNGVDTNSENGIPPYCSGFHVQRSESACFAQKKGTSSCMNPVAIFLISLSDKNFGFPNFQIPTTLAWRVSGGAERNLNRFDSPISSVVKLFDLD
jgi:hypothetical protein